MNKKKEDGFQFEEGMQRLEEIVQQFDEGTLSLDEMEEYFMEGMNVLEQCSKRLEAVESRVTKLIQDQKEKWAEVPVESADEDLKE